MSWSNQLCGVVLDTVLQEKYLGILLSHNMSWSNHIHTIATKARQKLGFLRCNLKGSPLAVRNLLMLLWCIPHLSMLASDGIHTFRRTWTVLNEFQRKATRWVTSTYDRKSSVSWLMRELQWETLQEHRRIQRLTFMYKILNGQVAVPAELIDLELSVRTSRGD